MSWKIRSFQDAKQTMKIQIVLTPKWRQQNPCDVTITHHHSKARLNVFWWC